MKTIFPGDNPVVLLAMRNPPLNPILDTPGNIFDDKMAVVNASQRGGIRGTVMPLLLDLARKPNFLHDSSVPTLDKLLDGTRGPNAPHPFYSDRPRPARRHGRVPARGEHFRAVGADHFHWRHTDASDLIHLENTMNLNSPLHDDGGAPLERIGTLLLRYGLALIFIWFGFLKFTAYEADGIAPLAMHSPPSCRGPSPRSASRACRTRSA